MRRMAALLLMLLPACLWAQSTSFRIAVGATKAVTDSKGQVWQTDSGIVSGTTSLSGCSPNSSVTGTTDPELYKAARWGGSTASEMTFTVTGLVNGTYTINALFADCAFNAAGQRVFSVQLQGAVAMSNIDIVGMAPGQNVALVKMAQAVVTNGTMVIKFLHGAANNPLVNAIQGVLTTPPPTPVPPTASIGPLAVTLSCQGAGQYVLGPLVITCNTAGPIHNVSLGWTGVTTCTQGTTSVACTPNYNVYKASVTGGPYTKIASTALTSYVDGAVTAGQTYYYVVTAYLPPCTSGQTTPCGESQNSNQVTATVGP